MRHARISSGYSGWNRGRAYDPKRSTHAWSLPISPICRTGRLICWPSMISSISEKLCNKTGQMFRVRSRTVLNWEKAPQTRHSIFDRSGEVFAAHLTCLTDVLVGTNLSRGIEGYTRFHVYSCYLGSSIAAQGYLASGMTSPGHQDLLLLNVNVTIPVGLIWTM